MQKRGTVALWALLLVALAAPADSSGAEGRGATAQGISPNRNRGPLAAEPKPQRGTVSGRVVDAVTGAPVAGTYVAIDHSGDAGGSNLERFRAEGIYVTSETDDEGRFLLSGVAFRDAHPFMVTCPGYVRHLRSLSLQSVKPSVEIEVALQPGASIVGTAVDERGEPMPGLRMRLEADDGRLFYPPREDWPGYPYRNVQTDKAGRFSFGELDAGTFRIDAMRIVIDVALDEDLLRVTKSEAAYVGGADAIGVAGGEETEIRLSPAGASGSISVSADVPSAMPPGTGGMPAGAILSRVPGPLAWRGGPYHLEDRRLGRMCAADLCRLPFDREGRARFTGLPAGRYALYVYQVREFPFQGRAVTGAFVDGQLIELTRGSEVEVRVEAPTVSPDWRPTAAGHTLDARVVLPAGERSLEALCELMSEAAGEAGEFAVDPSLAGQLVSAPSGEMSVWDALEGICGPRGWRAVPEPGAVRITP